MKHMRPQRLYRILSTSKGLYSTGGVNPKWTKNGRAWTTAAGLRRHLSLWLRERPGATLPTTWVVEAYTSVPTLFAHHTAAEFILSKAV